MHARRYLSRALPAAAIAGALIATPSIAASGHHHTRLSAQSHAAARLLRTAPVEQLAHQADPKGGWIAASDLTPRRSWTMHGCSRLRWSRTSVCEATLRIYPRAGGTLEVQTLIQVGAGPARFLTPGR